MMAMMMAVGGGEKAPMNKMPSSVEYTKEEITFALAVMEVERTIKNVGEYKKALIESPEKELLSMTNALNGGYTSLHRGRPDSKSQYLAYRTQPLRNQCRGYPERGGMGERHTVGK